MAEGKAGAGSSSAAASQEALLRMREEKRALEKKLQAGTHCLQPS